MNFYNQKLLVLGATSETCKLVQTASEMGIETFVVDPFENAPAKKYASHSILLDCFDVDAICNLVIQEKIDGILPGCADILIPVYEEVCRRTSKYCYVNKQIVKSFNNKKGLKSILKKHGLPVIEEYTVDEVRTSGFSAYPIFVKPADNNSSKGMYIANNLCEFEIAYEKSMSFSRSNSVLIEDYKQCDDFYIGYFIQDGNVKVAFTGDRFVISQGGVGSITSGIIYPSKYEKLYFDTVHTKMLRIFEELNFKNGICAIQGFVENGKIMFYDPALRITGGQEYILCNYFYGLDELKALICFALTNHVSENPIYEKCDCTFGGRFGCNLTFSVRPCVIGRIDGLAEAHLNPNVINITQEHKEMDAINRIGTAQQNIARMHLYADSKIELRDLIIHLQKQIVAYDTDGNNVMLCGLDPNAWYEGFNY